MRAFARLGVALVGVTLTLALGASDALAQTSGCPNDGPNRNYDCPLGPSYVIPGLTDLGGWTAPSHYRDILYGDLTGDGIDEMVARDAGGIHVYRYDRALGQWSEVITNEILSDAEGFGQPQYYETLRLGDIDGDGRAELIIRSSDGILTYRFTPDKEFPADKGTWTEINTSTAPRPMAASFEGASHYSTIQLTPLGRQDPKKKTMQLIGRGPGGLELYKWNGTGWGQLTTLNIGGVLTDAGGWTHRQYYTTIMPWDTRTVIIRSSAGLLVYKYTAGGRGSLGTWAYEKTADHPFVGAQRPESSYSTIQLIRGYTFNGHRDPAVIARSVDGTGLKEYYLDSGDWSSVPSDPNLNDPFSNKDGWDKSYYYRTIQTADLYGDGRDEVLGRGPNGMVAYSRAGAGWKPISLGTPALTDKPWAAPQYYMTITTAKLGPTSARSLVARGPYGIRTWTLDTKTNKWTRPRPYGSYPPLEHSTDPGTKKAYDALNQALGIERGEVRDLYRSPTTDENASRNFPSDTIAGYCKTQTSVVPPQYASCTPPSGVTGVDPGKWTLVCNQILKEMFWAQHVISYFNTLSSIQANLTTDETGALAQVGKSLQLEQAKGAVAPVNYLGLFESFFDILDELGVGPVAGVIAGAIEATDASTSTMSGPTTVQRKLSDLGTTLFKLQEEAADKITEHRHYVLGDYGLLATVGELTGHENWHLDENAAKSAGRQGFTTWLYKQFLPVLWDHWNVTNCSNPIRSYASCVPPDCADPDGGTCLPAVKDPAMATYTVHNDSANTTDFDGLVLKGVPCSEVVSLEGSCKWDNLPREGWTATLNTLLTPVSESCTYKPPEHLWEFGCTLGIPIKQLLSSAWGFRSISCDFAVFEQCLAAQRNAGIKPFARPR